ncbi:MAG: Holliday junction resolvase RuvX [Planctomycetes bacterium TMED75]|nr:Holliday junction resolvase RuvX [Planctomycetaceae bacterium]OUU94368.1 MAG: Holliday junction resolvase RuvX [Planctomycetes bacterium TMED75]
MRVLAIDIGGRRTGFATGDTELSLAQPIGVIEHANEQELMEAVTRMIEAHEPDELLVGLPLNMDDSEGPAATRMRKTAEQIGTLTGLPVHLQDERLTSFEADSRMAQSGRTHAGKKRIRDAIAAAALLEDYFASGS